MEAFVVTEEDLLFSTRQRKKRRFTKEDATYGIWAQRHDSDDEDVVDLTKPVNFVSGSAGKLFAKENEEEGDGDASDPDEQASWVIRLPLILLLRLFFLLFLL